MYKLARLTPMGRRRMVQRLAAGERLRDVAEAIDLSTTTVRRWWKRHQVEGDAGLQERSSRPLTSPWSVAPELAALLREARYRHPTWGPRKILDYLTPRHPLAVWPAASTIGTLFKRHGLVRPRRRHTKPGHPGRPTTPMSAPNIVWTADFKGHFALRGGPRCHPLTIVHGFSRYVLACQALPHPSTVESRPVFHRLFQEYGLPTVIRSDNGAPFATTALHRLSTLSVWWIKLGIRPELIEPASPQQNGRHERMHRTLKAEATRPPAASLRAQQRRFNTFRTEFNSVLIKNRWREHQFKIAGGPGIQESAGHATKENARHDHVGVHHDPHRDRRTFFAALAMSARVMPVCFATCRARPTKVANSLSDGGSSSLKITTSRSAITTNCAPASSPSCKRISSGMTTCPLDDSVVVAAVVMAAPCRTYQ